MEVCAKRPAVKCCTEEKFSVDLYSIGGASLCVRRLKGSIVWSLCRSFVSSVKGERISVLLLFIIGCWKGV